VSSARHSSQPGGFSEQRHGWQKDLFSDVAAAVEDELDQREQLVTQEQGESFLQGDAA
jgi:hypothetical protein